MGIRALRKIQIGKETTAGTAVPATTIWRGMGVFEDTTSVIFPEEDVGFLSGTNRAYIPQYGGKLEFSEVEATFEQLPYVLAAGVKNVTSGAADGSGSGKIYSYDFATTAANPIQTYTLEAGDDTRAERMAYSFVESFKLSGASGEAVKMSASWVGRQIVVNPFTASIAVPTVEEVLFQLGKLSIDNVSAAFGTTQITNAFLGFSLDVKTGFVARFTGDGSKEFSFIRQTAPEITLDVTFEYVGSATAEIDNWRNKTPRLIQLRFDGSTLATAGTTYQKKALIVNLAGTWESFEKLDEQDGNDVVTGKFRCRYDPTAAKFATVIVVNELATLP